MSVYDTTSEESRDEALTAATDAVRGGELIVLPTDTVYGIGADAFDAEAVQALLDAKGRGRSVPPPVLVADQAVLMALAVDVPDYAERLAEEFWPGALTLILNAQPSLSWDLGETRGTVALRMPDDPVALELLRRTGPLAVSSANRHGRDAALKVLDAATQLGDAVSVYLDGGPAKIGTSSTIIDTTVEPPEIVREGALTREQIIAAVGDIFTVEANEDSHPEETHSEDADTDESRAGDTRTGDAVADEPEAAAPAPDATVTNGAATAHPDAAVAAPDATPRSDAAGSAERGGTPVLPSEADSPVRSATVDPAATVDTPEVPEGRAG